MNKHEIWLRDALADLMGVEPSEVSLTSSFAEQGVDSLVGLRLARKLKDALDIEIELEWLFDHPSIHQLSQFLDEHLGELSVDADQSDCGGSECALTDSRDGCLLSGRTDQELSSPDGRLAEKSGPINARESPVTAG